MESKEQILEKARARGQAKGLAYAGELTPREAFDMLQQDPSTILVDVRSRAELELVGKVPTATHLEWAFYPGMLPNHAFAGQLEAQINKNLTVIFMCRTGGRSHNAAMLAKELGYQQVYNMLEGFEGEANSLHQRTLTNGWKHAGLPWYN